MLSYSLRCWIPDSRKQQPQFHKRKSYNPEALLSDKKRGEMDDKLIPQSAQRVAARAMVLSAISCRGAIEKDAEKPGAEVLRKQILPWLDQIGVTQEIEPAERDMLDTPLGKLDLRKALNATWRCEGLTVLAWALQWSELPRPQDQCDPPLIANSMGFLDERRNTPLHNPVLRPIEDIEMWGDTYLTLHWRLRLLNSSPGTMDFVSEVDRCEWGPLRIDPLEILNNDIAIDGLRIDKLDPRRHRELMSIAQERHQAFNWLLGFEQIYSQVTTDT
jgi:hypothetical protein